MESKQYISKDEFLDVRWEYHRSMMDYPRQIHRGQSCNKSHGGTWDWFRWDGDSYDEEKCYCQSCGRRVQGVKSPWAEKAMADWKASGSYKRRQAEIQQAMAVDSVRRKLVARRKAEEGRGWRYY